MGLLSSGENSGSHTTQAWSGGRLLAPLLEVLPISPPINLSPFEACAIQLSPPLPFFQPIGHLSAFIKGFGIWLGIFLSTPRSTHVVSPLQNPHAGCALVSASNPQLSRGPLHPRTP